MWLWRCMRLYLYWLDVILLTAVWRGGINDHALLGEHYSPVSHEPSDIILNFPSPSNFWRHWRHSTTQRSHEPSGILSTCTWAVGHSFNMYWYVGLHGPGWLYVLGITPRGDLPLRAPTARATGLGQDLNLCHGVRTGSLRATEPRAREKTRGRKRIKFRCAKKHIYTQ